MTEVVLPEKERAALKSQRFKRNAAMRKKMKASFSNSLLSLDLVKHGLMHSQSVQININDCLLHKGKTKQLDVIKLVSKHRFLVAFSIRGLCVDCDCVE